MITVDLADTVDGRTEMTFHVDGDAGRPGDEGVYDGWTEAFDILDGLIHRSCTELARYGTSEEDAPMNLPPIVSSEEWEAARQELLVEEKELSGLATRWRPSAGGCRGPRSTRSTGSKGRPAR